ncbi:hypothetical protein F7725_019720 [Dissostichus mawsoni]|uniref:Uncharacterized protein n=1 Tax=Dissostichus mawsoni TaxID=36200 RepID=A0A7J5YLX0_DISMA|nr:hypothetical protein F7725_019720 [Dissostichus mawsoni]
MAGTGAGTMAAGTGTEAWIMAVWAGSGAGNMAVLAGSGAGNMAAWAGSGAGNMAVLAGSGAGNMAVLAGTGAGTMAAGTETTCLKSLSLLSSPTAARTGPVKTGGRVFVLDHKRWTGPMKQAVDNLLNKHHGQKDMLKLVDKDYAALVLDSCTDPNSMLHPTTKHHICQYVKHLSKLLNTSSSINISPEKLQERQVLWHSLTEGSLTDPKMPFGDFAETAFFPQELEAMKQRVEARVQQKRKNAEPEHKGFFDDSKSDFQQVLKMNPDFEDAKVSLKQTLLDQQRKIDRGY